MRVLMIPTYFDTNRRTFGADLTSASARIRAAWVAQAWPDCELYDGLQRPSDYDVIIFQKVYQAARWREIARRLRDAGKIVAFDLCDPVWLQGAMAPLHDMLGACTLAVASTEPIREYLGRFLPAYTIPDRLDLAYHTERKVHTNSIVQMPSAVWFGYSANYEAAGVLRPVLEQYGVPLTTIADRPFPRPDVEFVEWRLETVNAEIVKHDLVLNPPGRNFRWAYKSNNKTITAWALGMPVAHNEEEVIRFLDWRERETEGAWRWQQVRDEYDVRLSVEEWKAVLAKGGQRCTS